MASETIDRFFTLICDEYTYTSYTEQFTLCLRWFGEDLAVREDFIGFCELHNSKTSNIYSTIEDCILTLNIHSSHIARVTL